MSLSNRFSNRFLQMLANDIQVEYDTVSIDEVTEFLENREDVWDWTRQKIVDEFVKQAIVEEFENRKEEDDD